ncbi:SDR family NAD(P)-dependent oxidoreductase [Paraburkholderia pallida]|uniref:Glucose 1-dehydrogenase n=1 Tax=Paraburkholderia pallida TaxID=2547399 RepID=A0A4P7CYM5_9BURK|nr:glucose 1-dehydrogenase [Paraburkholderia pallida]QBQ99163.1 glucose 1-dehydrogenase [Paraburkholderia pallida]
MSELFDLTAKVAVVTASTKGIGLAIARALGAAGARLVISGRSHESAEATAARLREEDGFEVTALACDITDPGSVQRFAADALAAFGRVDALVLNAAGKPPVGSLLDQTADHFDETMANGVRGSLALVLALAPQMIERRYGSILFMSSRAAKRGTGVLGLYGMSKAAIDQLVRNLAVELGPSNINVNSINPGAVRTDFSRTLWENPEREKLTVSTIPMGRIAEPEDVSGLALLLVSGAGHFINGQSISVDGGATA